MWLKILWYRVDAERLKEFVSGTILVFSIAVL
jgi:hypothetical protein